MQQYKISKRKAYLFRNLILLVSTDGYAGGVGLGIEYEKSPFKGGLSYEYTYGEQRFPGRFDDRRVTTPWNIPHQLSVDLSLMIYQHLHLESNWIQQLGRSWGFRRTYYDVFDVWDPQRGIALPDFQDPGNDSLPAYQRMDFGVRYVWQGKGMRSQLRFIVLNVLDRENVYDYSVEARENVLLSSHAHYPVGNFLFLCV